MTKFEIAETVLALKLQHDSVVFLVKDDQPVICRRPSFKELDYAFTVAERFDLSDFDFRLLVGKAFHVHGPKDEEALYELGGRIIGKVPVETEDVDQLAETEKDSHKYGFYRGIISILDKQDPVFDDIPFNIACRIIENRKKQQSEEESDTSEQKKTVHKPFPNVSIETV